MALRIMRTFAIIVGMALVTSVATAGGFDGPFVQAGPGIAHSRSEVDFTSWFKAKAGETTFNGQIAGGYSQSFGAFNLALSACYIIGDQKAGQTTQSYGASQVDTISMKLSQTRGLNIEPGCNLSESTLVYASLGYAHAKGTWSFIRPHDSYSGAAGYDGFSFGVGLKHKFNRNIYGFCEISQTDFKKKNVSMVVDGNHYTDSFEPESIACFIGLGYRF